MKHCAVEVYLKKAIFIIAATSVCLGVNAEDEPVEGNKDGDSGKVLAIVEVFNTSQALWLKWKNYTDDDDDGDVTTADGPGIDLSKIGINFTQTCTFIMMYNITLTDIFFHWNTIVNSQIVQSLYYGEFFEEDNDKLGSMNVTDISGGEKDPFQTMQLMFHEDGCSVFYVYSLAEDGESGCELYLRNDQVGTGPSQNCAEYYCKHCITQNAVYEDTCPAKVQEAKKELDIILKKERR